MSASSGRFEIQFLAAFDRVARRAFWLRHTRFTPNGGGVARATVWAALFDAELSPRRVAGKVFADGADWPNGCRLDGESAEGSLPTGLSWSLRFPTTTGAPARFPHIPEVIPAPTRSRHLLADAPFTGTIRWGAHELTLDGAGTMMHLDGHRRVDELVWMYAPEVAELTWVRPRRRGPALWAYGPAP